MMKKCIKITLTIILLVIESTTINAQTLTTNLDTTIRDVSDMNIGFNRRSDKGTWWTDNSFINLVSEINPDIVRYPGGTQANFWDWSEGRFLENPIKNWGNKEIVTIPTFVDALPNRTKIVYVVNMARPTPATGIDINATEAVLKSNATLNLKIQDMIDALDKFVLEGKEPYAVELGNEFYFGNEESGIFHIVEENGMFYSGWDSTNNAPYQSASKNAATDINALFYLEQAKEVVAQIKLAYPNMKFALVTTKSGSGTSARESWNNTIFDNLENNTDFATLKNDVLAVTQHHYLNDNYGVQTTISDIASAKVAIAEGIQYPIDKQADYDMVPNDFDIWYTEYGEVKGIAEETWADAVRYAALTYSWLTLGDQVKQLDFHYISDNTVVKVESPMRLAPVGIASKQFMLAAAEMAEMQQINFATNPISVNGVLSLYGYKFKNAEKETLLILNLNENNIQDVQFDNLFTYSGTPTMTQYYSDSPWVSGVAEGDSNIILNNDNVTTTFNSRKFSITVIEAIATKPTAPSSVVATEVDCTSIDLTWADNSDNETEFRIKQSINGAAYTLYDTTTENSTSYSATGLDENTTYTFRIVAYNADGRSTFAQGNTLTTEICPTSPTAPSSIVATEVDCTSIDLTWVDNSNDEDGFKLFRSVDGGTYTLYQTLGSNVTSYSATGLNESTSYAFEVVAYNIVGDSASSQSNTLTTSFCLTTTTLTTVEDAYVRNGTYQNNNYPSSNILHIREINTNGLKRISYLKFDLSNISNITSATLRLNNTGANGDVLLKKVSNDNWTEHDIKWNGRPAVGANIGTYLFTGIGTFDMDVTSYVSVEANGDGVVSFALKGVTSNFMTISSKESGNAPELIVEYSNSSAKSSNNKTVLTTQNFEDDNITIFVYPNPTTSLLNFKINDADVGKGKIQVFDVTGRLINTEVITGESMQLKLKGSSGLYIVKIQNKGDTIIKRIVKQ